MSFRLNQSRHARFGALQSQEANNPLGVVGRQHASRSTEPITESDVQGPLLQSGDREMCVRNPEQQKLPPMAVRLFTQFEDGSTREWDRMAEMRQLVRALCDVGSPLNGGPCSSLRIPAHDVAANVGSLQCAELMDAAACPPVSFFWIDITGTPTSHDLEVLFELLKVNARTRHDWRSAAAALLPREVWSSSSSADGAGYMEDPDLSLSSEEPGSGLRVLDELRAFVGERYMQLQLSAIPATCTVTAATVVGAVVQPSPMPPGEGGRAHQPDRLHANLFDVDNEEDLGCVRLLCFPDGIVTWRPMPQLEGWAYIARDVRRRLDSPSSTQRMITTSLLLHTILGELCEAFLPDPTAVLNEVDAIDAMLPLVRQQESDQADVLRRVLVLRRGLSVHRRLLLGRINLLEQLDRHVMRAMLSFVTPESNNDGAALKRSGTWLPAAHDANERFALSGNSGSQAAALSHGCNCSSIAQRIMHLLQQLDGARRVLGNATIIYTSGVAVRNNSNSNESDYRMVVLQYVLMIVLPMTILASQWGMNCFVPWQDEESTVPFWSLAGAMGAYSALFLSYPVYCWATGRPDKLVF